MAEERKAITVHVGLAAYDRIKATAFIEGKSVAAVCREALEDLFRNGKTVITPVSKEELDAYVKLRSASRRGVNTATGPTTTFPAGRTTVEEVTPEQMREPPAPGDFGNHGSDENGNIIMRQPQPLLGGR